LIRLKAKRVDHKGGNTPVLTNREIDEFAHAVLSYYKPELLEEPGKIRFEHFLEFYLGVNIFYEDIYHEDPERPIFGATAFQNGTLKVFDKDEQGVKIVNIPANSVVIDNYVMQEGKEGLATFTGLHEAGHLLMHWEVYGGAAEPGDRVICCYRESIESFYVKATKRTTLEWREYQADYFAAAIAMPNATFKPFVHKFLREHGVRKGAIILGRDEDLDILAEVILPEGIGSVYGVSKRAASVKLRKLGFVLPSTF